MKVKREKEQIKKEYSCVQEQVENLRQNSSEAVTIGRRSGSGKITINYSNELVKTWGGSPASETLSYGSSTTYFNDNINAETFLTTPVAVIVIAYLVNIGQLLYIGQLVMVVGHI